MSDLRPCPWCDVIPDTDDGESGGTVECCNRQCPVQPSIFRDHEPSHNGLSLATDEWNTRASDAQAENLAGLLRDLNEILGLCDQGRAGRVHDHMDMQAVACGECDGYGAWMDALQRMWQERDQIGCFTIGPCLGTVRHARKRIDAALAAYDAGRKSNSANQQPNAAPTKDGK